MSTGSGCGQSGARVGVVRTGSGSGEYGGGVAQRVGEGSGYERLGENSEERGASAIADL